ncbi:hypothetical protein A0126_01590 [Exiguobacterium sp. N4-1P]|nr:hypothetical protein A0126_01590 [Exiguobacterium sp. N4-1P]
MFNYLVCTDLNNINNYKRIYYGEGNIIRSKKNRGDYIIFFEAEVRNKDNKQTPLYISAKIINESLNNKKIDYRTGKFM